MRGWVRRTTGQELNKGESRPYSAFPTIQHIVVNTPRCLYGWLRK